MHDRAFAERGLQTGDGYSRPVPEGPDFTPRSRLLQEAYEFALAAHHGPARRGDTDISHPVAVAELLQEQGCEEAVIAAALLHDVIEDTGRALGEIGERFGRDVCRLVQVMTEDATIESYGARKAEHRERVVGAGRDPAAIYAADKLAKIRMYVREGTAIPEAKFRHYRDTIELFTERRPDLPFIAEAAAELQAVQVAAGEQTG